MEAQISDVVPTLRRGSGESAPERMRTARNRRRIALLASACAALGLHAPASAQTLDNKYWVSAMAFFPKVDTDVRVATKTQADIGTDIDFEKDLALDKDEILPSFTAGARFGRVIVGADFYKLNRNGQIGLARDISFDGVVYPATAQVRSGFDSEIYRLTVGYAFVQNSTVELGAAIGAHVTRFEMSLSGVGTVGGVTGQSEVRRRNVLAPLPTIGAFVTYKVAPRVELNGRFDWLSLKVDDYDGRLLNAQVGANYAVAKNLQLGVAYRYVDYRLGIDKERWDGRVRYKLHGPAVQLQASF
ncbi:outer membrane beta-barrel protein [Novosphingobium sp. YAF33]|uniref:outer membrane beta-barrel protein n=1 Tax=Novosphingobium sp. YAF33 TaxID=3233082 RepID=UPI003F96F6A3